MLVWHCRTRQDSGQIVWHDFPKQVQRFLCCTSAVLCISHDTINEICIVDVYFFVVLSVDQCHLLVPQWLNLLSCNH